MSYSDRVPRLSIVMISDQLGHNQLTIADDDTGVIEPFTIVEDTTSIAPTSIAGIPLFSFNDDSFDDVSIPCGRHACPRQSISECPPMDVRTLLAHEYVEEEQELKKFQELPTYRSIPPPLPTLMERTSSSEVSFASKSHIQAPPPPIVPPSTSSAGSRTNPPPLPTSTPTSANSSTSGKLPPPLPSSACTTPSSSNSQARAPGASFSRTVSSHSQTDTTNTNTNTNTTTVEPPLTLSTNTTSTTTPTNGNGSGTGTYKPSGILSPVDFFKPLTPSTTQAAADTVVEETTDDIPTQNRGASYSLSYYPVKTNLPAADLETVGTLKQYGSTYTQEVIRTAHVHFNAATGQLQGLPEEWEAHLNKKFGIPLQLCATLQVPGYTSRLPPILIQMKKYLVENGGLDMKGIFRLAPEESEASKVKQQLNEGTFESCDDVNVIANLLKVWFRDMPARLLDQIREPHLLLDCTTSARAGEIIMTKMKEPHLTLLLWLLDLCCDISSNSHVNMMTPQNMAIVFTPNLFKLADDTSNTSVDPIQLMTLCKKYTQFVAHAIEWRLNDASRPFM